MEIKKNPKANLENYSKFFMELGLVLALFVAYLSFEYKSYDKTISDLGKLNMQEQVEEDIPITQRVEPVKPPPPPPPAPEKIEVVKDDKDVEETVLQSTETDENTAVKVDDIQTVAEDDEPVDDVPFAIIENPPIFPGCGNLPKDKQKACFSQKVSKIINKNFNVDLASDLGLSPGRKRIFVMFKIDKTGKVVNVRARGPHKRLEQEAIRVVKLIPRLKPGKQRGRPVGVKYSLPIVFNVQE